MPGLARAKAFGLYELETYAVARRKQNKRNEVCGATRQDNNSLANNGVGNDAATPFHVRGGGG